MNDWRTRPRTGRSQFIPLMNEIKNRLDQGETNKQIHDDLTAQDRIEIGYDQFARYIRKHFKAVKEVTAVVAPVFKPDSKVKKDNHPFNFGQRLADGERRREEDFHSSVPNKERIYGKQDD